ncbi:MAG: RNA methyltransferase [Syntrophaceae bacterium]|nr:RNA methyltransferase [Syntrophaceae bacterium]
MANMKANLDSVSIILVRPRFPENIGSVARAMKNMGLNRLVLVGGPSPLQANAYKLASGAEEILERAEEFPTLREAISEMGCVVGTTSRTGKERRPLLTPKSLMKRVVPISHGNLIGLVFGSEKEGLTNEELSLCHLYAKIPSSNLFPSLNLAQAVMVVCYELFQSTVTGQEPAVELAKAEQLEGMFEHMEQTLVNIGFLDARNPKRIMRVLRRLFGRSGLEEREVRILQGIWSRVDWCLKGSNSEAPRPQGEGFPAR